MKKLLSLLVLCVGVLASYGQDKFEVTDTKFIPTQSVVIIKDSNSSALDLYNETLSWLNETYKQPDEVIKAKNEGSYIKINGSTKFYNDLYKYTIEFRFKDGKIKMEIIALSTYINPTQYITGGWTDATLNKVIYLKKNGKPDKYINNLRTQYADEGEKYFNGLLNSLIDYSNNSSMNDW